MTISPSQSSAAVAKPVTDGSVDSLHSRFKFNGALSVKGVPSEIHTSSIGSPHGMLPVPMYCQLYCTTFSTAGAESNAGSEFTTVITTPSSATRKPPLAGLASISQTMDGQKLSTFGSASSIVKQTLNNLVHWTVS